jgi:hypothetical protein
MKNGLKHSRRGFSLALSGCLLAFLCAGAFAEDAAPTVAPMRARPADVRVVLDMSLSLESGRYGAINWLCDYIDRNLQENDTLLVIAAREKSETVYDGPVGTGKDWIKQRLRDLDGPAGTSYAAAALQTIADRVAVQDKTRIPVTFLICGPDVAAAADNPKYLQFSRTQNFPYWHLITLGIGIENDIDRAVKKAVNTSG